MIEPLLTKGVGGVAFAFRDRFGAGQPAIDVMGERLIGVGEIAFDLGLSLVEGIAPCQQPLFQYSTEPWIEQGPKRALAMPRMLPFANLPRTHLIESDNYSYSHSMVPGGLDVTS